MIASIGSFMLYRRETMQNIQGDAKIDSTTGDPGTTESSEASTPIPLPRTHVHRTESEVRLSDDQAAAEQREIHMFYRLLHGIRKRQELGYGASSVIPPGALPPRVVDESPPIRPARNMFGWQLGSVPPVVQPMSQGSGTDMAADSWSITGFDGHQADNDSRLSMNISAAAFSPPDVCDEEETFDEEDEGIFAMDL